MRYAIGAGIATALLAGASGAYAQTNAVSTVAGTGTAGFTGDGGPAAAARLSNPIGVSVTPDGGYLIVDQGNNRIRRVFPNGTIVTIAGIGGAGGFGGDGGPAVLAQLNIPNGAVMGTDGSVLIADSLNNRVRRVDPGGTITTVAGGGPGPGLGDGDAATNATLAFPADVDWQSDGGFLIADNDNDRIRRVSPGGTITTVAGTTQGFSGDNNPATSAQLNDPASVTSTPGGGFLIADKDNHRVRRVDPNGTITTAAGVGTPGSIGDGGPATAAALNLPANVAYGASSGSILIADRANHRIRHIALDGTITTVTGTGTAGFNGDGLIGTATDLNSPFDVVVNPEGDYLIADTSNHRIRAVDAGAPPPTPPPPPSPVSLTLDPTGADRKPGDANAVTATARLSDGSPAANRRIRWSVAGANPGTGNATADASGTARITWDGVHEGTDTLTAFVDTNDNSAADVGEPNATATVSWTLPVPAQGRTFNIEPVSGIVKIRVIRRGKDAHAAGSSGFATLTEAMQVPVTTVVDVRKGRVRQTLAANRAGDVQKGEFYGGIYTTTQPRSGARPVTELKLSESLICQPNSRGKATAGRARSRRLWGSGKGRFRTRGRNSTATVRGTIWLTKDTCSTTTTVVREGIVTVRDLVKRKNVTVKAGRSYVARARTRR